MKGADAIWTCFGESGGHDCAERCEYGEACEAAACENLCGTVAVVEEVDAGGGPVRDRPDQRDLCYMEWQCTLPARKEKRAEDKERAELAAKLVGAGANRYGCFGIGPHLGCVGRCEHYEDCTWTDPAEVDGPVAVLEESG